VVQYLALDLLQGLGPLQLDGFGELREQAAPHLLLPFLCVLVLRKRQSPEAFKINTTRM